MSSLGLEMRKLWPFKTKGSRTPKKQITKYYKGWLPNTHNILCMLLLEFKDDL